MRWLWISPLVLTLVGIATWFQLESPLPSARAQVFSTTALEAAITRLQPVVERALGRPFEREVHFRVVSRATLAGVLSSEMSVFVGNSKERGGLEAWSERVAKAFATVVFAKVELDSGRLNLVPQNFRSLDARSGGAFELNSAPFRDVVLAHELVHVFQFQSADAAGYFGVCRNIDEFQGPGSVVEGFAQFIAARVSHAMDLDDAFGRLTGITTGDFPDMPEKLRSQMRVAAGLQAFPYYRGRQLVERVVRQRGYERAVEALLANAPRSQLDVTIAQRYLPPEEAALRYEVALKRVKRFLKEKSPAGRDLRSPRFRRKLRDEGKSREAIVRQAESMAHLSAFKNDMLCSVDFRLQWSDLDLDDVASALDGFIAGDRLRSPIDDVTVTLYRCRDESSALRFADVLAQRRMHDDPDWQRADTNERTWTRGSKSVRTTRERCTQRLYGSIVIEVRAASGQWPRLDDADLSWTRSIRELVRSAYERAPWTGLPRSELRDVFLEHARSTDWGLRWRAVRNLGRLGLGEAAVFAGVLGALSDEDADIRLAALEAIVLWDRLPDIPKDSWKLLRKSKDRRIRRIVLALPG